MPPQLARVDRRLLVGGAGLAGVVLGWVLLVTVFGGGGDDVALPITAGGPAPAVTRTTVAPPTTTAYAPPGRDPFRPNASAPAAAAGQPSVQAVAPAASPTSAATAPAAGPAPGPGQAALELKSIANDSGGTLRATITVDGRSYSPAKGEAFSHGYRLESIDGTCVEVSAQSARARMCLPTAPA